MEVVSKRASKIKKNKIKKQQFWNTLRQSNSKRTGANKSVEETGMTSIISDFDRRRTTAGNETRHQSSIVDPEVEEGTTQASGLRTPIIATSTRPINLAYANERVAT